jgi:DNA-binding transcriptional regulator YiaG
MKYKSEIREALHEHAVEMYKVGAITEASMREYDEMCLDNPKAKQESIPAYDNSINIKHVSHATV